jgi:hypothetical protein
MEETTRQGFHTYRRENPSLRYGQAFCNYFKYQDTDNVLFNATDSIVVEVLTNVLMDNWQTP